MGRLRSGLKRALQPGWDTSDFFPSLDHDLEVYGHLLTGQVLNAGAGNRDISGAVAGTVVNQEIPGGMHPGKIDIWAPLEDIPREDGHFDSIVCNAVLEHVTDPERVMTELARVIKAGGFMYLSVPFMQPEHKDPIDGQRYTLDGLGALCDRHGFDVVESGPIHSVEATVGWVLTNWLRGENRLRVLVPGRLVHLWLRRSAADSERQVPSIASAHRALARRRAT